MIIKVIIVIFALYVIWKTILRFQKGDITSRELTLWTTFWLLVGGVALVPKKTDAIAQWLGVERGSDLLVYLSIIVLFFIVFKIVVKLEKINRDITKVVRREALEEKNKNHE
ncbi:MAG: DUF2304 domain-containing protein [Patescibacteria group bacterium]